MLSLTKPSGPLGYNIFKRLIQALSFFAWVWTSSAFRLPERSDSSLRLQMTPGGLYKDGETKGLDDQSDRGESSEQ